MSAICLITLKPNKIWCDFLNQFTKYKIFIIIDDNNFDCGGFQNDYKNISFIKIHNLKCEEKHYLNMNFMMNKLITGWEKALYYFYFENNMFDHVWFIEDDVFFESQDTIINIDKKYINDDLLSSKYFENKNGVKNYWHWRIIDISYSPPYYSGMMCAVRLSKKMMACIKDYAEKNKTLFFLEALFPTIAIKNNLFYRTPEELNKIYYRHEFKEHEFNKVELYHPVKKITDHIIFRNNIMNNTL